MTSQRSLKQGLSGRSGRKAPGREMWRALQEMPGFGNAVTPQECVCVGGRRWCLTQVTRSQRSFSFSFSKSSKGISGRGGGAPPSPGNDSRGA